MSDSLQNRLREFYPDLLELESGLIGLISGLDQPREEIVRELNAAQDQLAALQRRFSGIRLHELGVLASNNSSPGLAGGSDASLAPPAASFAPQDAPGLRNEI